MRDLWRPWWLLVLCAAALGLTVLVLAVVKGVAG